MSNTVSVICVYNNQDILKNYLLVGLKKQSIDFEFIGVDNTNNTFKSAAQALNYGFNESSGKFLVFVHQDLLILDNNFLEKVVRYFLELGDIIMGIAGNKFGDPNVYSNIEHSVYGRKVGFYQVIDPVIVDTLDEVFFSLPSDIFRKVMFDELICFHWHLYALDLCLNLKLYNISSIVISCNAFHLSNGKLDKNFFSTLKLLIAKHKNNFKQITTTCVNIHTNDYSMYAFVLKNELLKFKLVSRINSFKNKLRGY